MTKKRRDKIIHTVRIGSSQISVGEKWGPGGSLSYDCTVDSANGRHVTADVQPLYIDIMESFSEQVRSAVEDLRFDFLSADLPEADKLPVSPDSCRAVSDSGGLTGKVVALDPAVMPQADRYAARQLYLCTGGIGSLLPFGRAGCRCTALYTGKTARCRRGDLLGTVDETCLKEWAAANLKQFRSRISGAQGTPPSSGDATEGEI